MNEMTSPSDKPLNRSLQVPESVWEGLGPRAKVIAQYWLEHPNDTLREMSKVLLVTPSRISTVINSNRFLRALKTESTMTLKRKGLALATKSYLECIVSKKSEEVKFRASSELLKAERVLSPETIEINHKFAGMTVEELKHLVKRHESINPPVIDVDVEPEK